MPEFTIHLSEPDGVPRLIQALGIENPISTIRAIRGTGDEYRVRFVRDGAYYRPPGIALSYVVKEDLEFDGGAVVSCTGGQWTTPATDDDFYVGNPNYGTVELNALLFSPDGNAENDVPEVTLMGAFSFRVGAAVPKETERFAVIVSNKVITGDEVAPVSGGPDLDTRISVLEAGAGIGAGFSWASTAFLSINGDDDYAEVANQFKPYATPQAAFDAGARVLFLFPNPDGYGAISTTEEVDLTLIAIDGDTSISGITSPAGVTVTGNGRDLVTIFSITTSPLTIAAGDPAGDVEVRGCTIQSITAQGGYAGSPADDGGNGGDVLLRDANVVSGIDQSGGAGGVGADPGAAGELSARYTHFSIDPGPGSFQACMIEGVFVDDSLPVPAPAFVALTDGGTITLTCDTRNTVQNSKVTLGGNRTLAISGAVDGMTGIIQVTQDGTGSRTLALPAGSKVTGGGVGAVTLSPAAGAVDILGWSYNGSTFIFTAALNAN